MCSRRSKIVETSSSERWRSSSRREEQADGQTTSSSPCPTRSAPDAAARAVRELWATTLGGLPCPAHVDDFSGIGSPYPGGATLPQRGMYLVSCALSSRRRRGLGAAPWGVWLGYHHGDRSVALRGAPLYPRDPSAPGPAGSEHRPAHRHGFVGTVRGVSGTAPGG